jgi:hypothetical protein
VPELGKVTEETVALWLLALICSHHARSKHTVMELGGVDIVSDRLASHTAHRQVHFSHLKCLFMYNSLNLFKCNKLVLHSRCFLLSTAMLLSWICQG